MDAEIERWWVEQLLVLGWHDGPEVGFCRLTNGAESLTAHFELIDERRRRDAPDDRLFVLKHLPSANFDELMMALRIFDAPQQPIWSPSWDLGGAAVARALGSAERAIGEPFAVVRTALWTQIDGLWAADQHPMSLAVGP